MSKCLVQFLHFIKLRINNMLLKLQIKDTTVLEVKSFLKTGERKSLTKSDVDWASLMNVSNQITHIHQVVSLIVDMEDNVESKVIKSSLT